MAEGKIFLKENRDRIEKKYREQVMGLPQAFADIDKKLAECTDEVALACKYLYAFMPYSDIGNYAFEVFLDYAENGVHLLEGKLRGGRAAGRDLFELCAVSQSK